MQKSIEHLYAPRDEKLLFAPMAALSALLLCGVWPAAVCILLFVNTVFILHRFNGPYNGGSDRMGLLILFCLTLAQLAPTAMMQEYALGYLALQVVLSYFISGFVKIVNPDWRSGRALRDVFQFSAYPVAESLRAFALRPTLLFVMSWAVMLFELAFPVLAVSQAMLILALGAAAAFHLANACLFGLNRFFWIWIAGYPSLLWLQSRLFV